MPVLTIYLPKKLYYEMRALRRKVNWSKVAQKAFREETNKADHTETRNVTTMTSASKTLETT